MSISLVFSEKPKTGRKQKAIEILSTIPHEYRDGKFFIKSDDINPEIKNLIRLSCDWKTTKLFLNKKEINLQELGMVFYCNYRDTTYKQYCNGICHIYFRNLFDSIILYHMIDTNSVKNCPFFKFIDDKEIDINEELFNKYLAEKAEILQFCDKFNIDWVRQEFRKLPKHINLKNISSNGRFYNLEQ